MLSIEAPAQAAPRWAALRRDVGVTYAVNGLIGFIFAATGPVAVILSVGLRGGLSESDLASWIFGAFFLNGLITLLMSWRYRQPLAFFWTIPGTVLVGPALEHLSFAQVIGAFFATGVLLLLLGISGWVRRAMAAVPMPIVMGMVAGVFLRFGTDLVRALHQDVPIAAPMVVAFLLLSGWPRLGKRLPPMLGALLVGAIAVVLSARFAPQLDASMVLARPHLYAPAWSLQAMIELVLPLAITVLVVQNGQGVAVLKVAGHEAPVNAVTLACGIGSMVSAFVGTVSTCLTGPTNAIIISSGEQRRHYTGALVVGLLAMAFGLLSPLFTRLMLATPPAFIATLAGLAMLRVLQTAFVASFAGRFSLGALVAFLVTVTDLTILNIGAAFWGLVAGVLVSLLLERADFAALRGSGG
ncbi:MAG: benzoate transporter [Comamonas sp. SCN 65-56]|uniref:benzoate/H(+) symporter BenE family transporter n=1 Tax=Comamonas sp. SCN 65-56 TaxID=1660095 RepID=UPI00086A7DA6|nr:benzoate/H(+) symporter BenE family transporter [Comamonas sp. SCN 65-56]ODS91647.1 MAG: benzoate transporter [Comamonas sp. SCN 65-56]